MYVQEEGENFIFCHIDLALVFTYVQRPFFACIKQKIGQVRVFRLIVTSQRELRQPTIIRYFRVSSDSQLTDKIS